MLTPNEMTEMIVKALDSKKANEIKVLETRDVTVLADYFVICKRGGRKTASRLSAPRDTERAAGYSSISAAS